MQKKDYINQLTLAKILEIYIQVIVDTTEKQFKDKNDFFIKTLIYKGMFFSIPHIIKEYNEMFKKGEKNDKR